MADIVNLRRARKEKARGAKAAKAQENRLLHGASKKLRDLTKARSEKADTALFDNSVPSHWIGPAPQLTISSLLAPS